MISKPSTELPRIEVSEDRGATARVADMVQKTRSEDAITERNKEIFFRVLTGRPVAELIPGIDARISKSPRPGTFAHERMTHDLAYLNRVDETKAAEAAAEKAGEEYTGPVVGPRVITETVKQRKKLTRRQQTAAQRKYDRDQAQIAAQAEASDGSEWVR